MKIDDIFDKNGNRVDSNNPANMKMMIRDLNAPSLLEQLFSVKAHAMQKIRNEAEIADYTVKTNVLLNVRAAQYNASGSLQLEAILRTSEKEIAEVYKLKNQDLQKHLLDAAENFEIQKTKIEASGISDELKAIAIHDAFEGYMNLKMKINQKYRERDSNFS